MQRIIGLIILNVSMIVFAAGAAAVPSARQWIIADYGFKTQTFLIGGIIVMVTGATMACSVRTGKVRARALTI
jgi:uncharacterized membrane protein YjjP (DUF1212 family)